MTHDPKHIEALASMFEDYRLGRDGRTSEEIASAVLDLFGPKPLVWDYIVSTNTWQAQSLYGEYSVGFDDGWWGQLIGNIPWEWEPEYDPRTYDAAKAAAEAHHVATFWAMSGIGGAE